MADAEVTLRMVRQHPETPGLILGVPKDEAKISCFFSRFWAWKSSKG
jgi:hypothetical protein